MCIINEQLHDFSVYWAGLDTLFRRMNEPVHCTCDGLASHPAPVCWALGSKNVQQKMLDSFKQNFTPNDVILLLNNYENDNKLSSCPEGQMAIVH